MRKKMDFDQFVEWIKYSSSTCVHPAPHVNQLDWLVDQNGDILVDFIGKFETLNEDWKYIAEKLQLHRPLPHLNENTNKNSHYTEYYNDKTKNIIQNKFATDINYFEYEFKK